MKKYALIIVIFIMSCRLSGSSGSWQKLDSLPEPSAGFACAQVEGRILVLGGTNWTNGRKHWLKSVHAFDLKKLQWTTLVSLGQTVAYPVTGDTGEAMIVAGGTTGEAPFAGAVLVGENTEIVQGKTGVTTPSVFSAGGWVGGKLIFVGGTDSPVNLAGFRRAAFAWDPRTGREHPLPPYPGPAFGIGAAVAVGDELLVFGGCRFDTQTGAVVNLAEAHAFCARRNSWRALKPMPRAVRAVTPIRLDERYIYLAGGYGNDPGGFTDAAFVYDLVGDRYLNAPRLPYRAALVGLILYGDYVYCIAGEDKAEHRTGAVYRIKRSELLAEVRSDP